MISSTIASKIISCLDEVLPGPNDKQKLIAQCYDGAAVMSGCNRGVQTIVKQSYPNSHYVHCYAHQLNLILQQAVSQIPQMRLFFANINGFSVFFSRSPKRVEYLDKSVARRIPRSSQTRWNFQSRIVETVHRHQHDLVACFEEILDNWNGDQLTVREASGLLNWLQDKDFLLYLEFFHRIFPHVEILFAQLQKRGIDPAFIQGCITNFISAMNNE